MKKIIISLLIAMYGFMGISQDTLRIEGSSKLSNSQKYGITITEGTITLNIVETPTTLSYNTREGQSMTNLTVKKSTDTFTISESGGNYSFYDKKKKQLYVIDYFMSRYSVSSYGIGYSEIKQTNIKMMDMLKSGSTQKDVIQFLVKQTEYDF